MEKNKEVKSHRVPLGYGLAILSTQSHVTVFDLVYMYFCFIDQLFQFYGVYKLRTVYIQNSEYIALEGL